MNQDVESKHNLYTQSSPNPHADVEYARDCALLIAKAMVDFYHKGTTNTWSFGQQHILQKGLKMLKEKGHAAAMKELDQLHKRMCFTPVDINDLTTSEKKKAMEAMMLLTEKKDKTVKGRMVYNGKPSREWLTREDAASPTASLESIMITGVIDTKEERDVMTADVPNAFIQAPMPEVKPNEDRVMMKITGVLVDMLVQLCPEVYGPYVVFENGRKLLSLY